MNEVDGIKVKPTHPGEVLLEDYLKPLGITPNALAIAIRVPASRISEIVKAKRAVTAETALRLTRYFGGDPDFWLRLQARYDRCVAEDTVGATIDREVVPRELVATRQ
ncbi:MAG: HigA family addiction module antitoxin [Vulcanimicrobiaceae bacterium]